MKEHTSNFQLPTEVKNSKTYYVVQPAGQIGFFFIERLTQPMILLARFNIASRIEGEEGREGRRGEHQGRAVRSYRAKWCNL